MIMIYTDKLSAVLFNFYEYMHHFMHGMKLQDSCAKILDILGRKPDLVIGNYTDGNLVAYLVSRKLGVTQVKNSPLQYIKCAMQNLLLVVPIK